MILADALDECEEWGSLGELLLWFTAPIHTNVSIIVSGRRSQIIINYLSESDFVNIPLEGSPIQEDIELYVEESLRQKRFSKIPGSIKIVITKEISHKAAGMYVFHLSSILI